MRAKVEHPFLIVKRDFGFTKTRYRGIGKNLNHLHMLFASANWPRGMANSHPTNLQTVSKTIQGRPHQETRPRSAIP